MLHEQHCLPCSGGLAPLSEKRVGEYLKEIPGWTIVRPPLPTPPPVGEGITPSKIARTWKFKDFKEALAFVNRVGELAETEGHHPDIHIHWNRVTLELWTHVAKGLTENDFILASKIDALENAYPP